MTWGRRWRSSGTLQVESYFTVLLVVVALDVVYGMHQTDDGRWGFAPRAGRARVAAYLILLVLALVRSAEAPVCAALQLPLPDDIGASVAHYFRRGLEGVLTSLGLMLFFDLVRPGALRIAVPRTGSPSAENATAAEPDTVGRG